MCTRTRPRLTALFERIVGIGDKTCFNSKGKSPQPDGAEESGTASRSIASQTHYQLSSSGPQTVGVGV